MLTSSVVDEGRRFACDEELVIFTCEVFESSSLEWSNNLTNPISYDTVFDTPPIVTNRPPFRAVFVGFVGPRLDANLTSTLEVNASQAIMANNTFVQCQDSEPLNFTTSGKYKCFVNCSHVPFLSHSSTPLFV